MDVTDVTKGRDIDRVIVLGSGMSILKLTDEETAHINRCKVVIAVNKFMAFYKLTGILPTHIYYHDGSGANIEMFRFILNTCIKDKLENLTIITNPFFKMIKRNNAISSIIRIVITDILMFRLKVIIKILIGRPIDSVQKNVLFRKYKRLNYPQKCNIIGIKTHHWMKGGDWSNSLKKKLYHYRGSITTVLNYVSICYPNIDIFLIGNDYNGSKYFYEEQLEALNINWKDHTFDQTKAQNRHFSFQIIDGTKMTDKFPEIMKHLLKSNNSLYCNNDKSLIVTEANVEYRKLISLKPSCS
ncbi:MAG: hypothetical protein JW976_06635 [Syntrophaceae bacterium]|nr:hypothetical protein [Syntrophaceae bacterium]